MIRRRRFVIIGVTAGLLLAGAVAGGLLIWWLKAAPSSLPPQFDKASFSIFYPRPAPGTTTLTLQPTTTTYDNTNNGLSYDVLVDGKKVVVTEQASPDVFSQNGVYEFKLNQAHQYDSFVTAAGEVTLTKPDELHGQTVAWVNAKGTLTLAHALQDLTEAQWKQLFNSMVVVR